jgi:parallel beta-helix repeat protein
MSRTQKVWLPNKRPQTVDEHAANVRYLDRLDLDGLGNADCATYVIAAHNSVEAAKEFADFVCDGFADNLTVQLAVDALIARGGGKLLFREGNYAFSGTVTVTGTANIMFEGLDSGGTGGVAQITMTGAHVCFTGNAVAIGFSDLAIIGAGTGNVDTIYFLNTQVIMRGCYVTATGSGSALRIDNGNGDGDLSSVVHNTITVNGSGNAIRSTSRGAVFANNWIGITGSGRGIFIDANSGNFNSDKSAIVGNVIQGSGGSSSWGIDCDLNGIGGGADSITITGNSVSSCGVGIILRFAQFCVVSGNTIRQCATGVITEVTATSNAIVGNVISGSTTNHVKIRSSSVDITVAFNKFSGTGPTNAVAITAGCSNCAVFYNDTYNSYSGSALSDAGTSTRTESSFATVPLAHESTHLSGGSDALSGILDAIARVGVRKNSAGSTSQRRRLNLIEGTNVTITVADDSVDEEVDVTIAAAGGGGSMAVKVDGSSIGTESTINFLHGTNVTLSGSNPAGEVDVTINATGATGLDALPWHNSRAFS